MNSSNPFNKLIEAIREEGKFYNEPSFFIGKVKNKLPNLEVYWCDQVLVKKQLKIDKLMLDRNDLEIGDTVIMFRHEEGFIIISKVVQL